MSRTRSGYLPGGWRVGEVWLDSDELDWFGELKRGVQEGEPLQPLLLPAAAGVASGGLALRPLPYVPRQPRRGGLVPAVAALAAVGLGVPLLLQWRAAQESASGLAAAPPAPVVPAVRVPLLGPAQPAPLATEETAPPTTQAAPAAESAEPSRAFPEIRWRESSALGVPHAGRLVDGVQLPVEGPGWVTWDPVLDRVPNRSSRLWGTDELIRVTLDVIASYRLANPDAPPVVVGDLSHQGGGEIDEHASHENGLDVDVYYPRRDGRPVPPSHPGQVDVRLAQDLVDRFLKAGAEIMFVGYSVPLHGPGGVVVPYPNHDDHVHVRIAPPGR